MEAEINVVYWVVRDPKGEAIGVVATSDRPYTGVTINDKQHAIDKISKVEFETYLEFEIPLYGLDGPDGY